MTRLLRVLRTFIASETNRRRRGVQSALLAARIDRAAEAGCDLAVCLAQPGSSSQRNIIRQGFGVLYTRVKFERHWN